ncbi:MAG TPA: glycosyltransferase [Puia sp.]|nr:glycosyltransferase [Puia sp.]
MRKRILIMTEWFYPGFKAGGPIRACHNLAMLLKDEYDLYIFTSDRDLKSESPYAGITPNRWVSFSANIKVFYASPENLKWFSIKKEIQKIDAAHVYLNSMYSLYFTIYPLLMKRIGKLKSNIILSPRGMLKESALQFKYAKKKSFLEMLKLFKISKGIGFHATDEQEKKDIRKIFGDAISVNLIQDVPPEPEKNVFPVTKRSGELKLVFVGRIHRIKNLHFIMECLKKLTQKIELTVIGPIDDNAYYEFCKKLSASLPENVSIHFAGEVSNEKIKSHLRENHFMILPTLGENYCYSIIESFCAGRPVIITDRTPWQNLSNKKIGWDLPLDHHKEFLIALNSAASMVQEEFTEWSSSALNFSKKLFTTSNCKAEYSEMFS